MAPPVDRETAQALVRRIAKDHGYLGEDVLQRLEPDLRLEIEEAFLKKDLMIGSSVITYVAFSSSWQTQKPSKKY